MNTKRWSATTGLIITTLFAVLLGLAGCGPGQSTTPTPLPTLSLDQTSVNEFAITNFDAVHSPANGDTNQYLILGNLPVSKPAADLDSKLAAFLGRWEGYSYAPPVKKDRKIVLVIQEITAQEGKAVGWSGTNLQYPDRFGEIHFRVLPGDAPSIEFQIFWPGNNREIDTYTYDRDKDLLTGWAKLSANNSDYGPIEFKRDQSFYIYKDYAKYLGGKRIYSKSYQNSELQRYGMGYLLYLPEGYEERPEKTWPLIFFLHGYGDRGDNVFLLAKASPSCLSGKMGLCPLSSLLPC